MIKLRLLISICFCLTLPGYAAKATALAQPVETAINACAIASLADALPYILATDPITGEPDCTIRYAHKDYSTTGTAELEEIIRTGITAWRKQEFDNRACVQCHGPDMIEFAYLDYGAANFLRRSSQHVVPATTEKLLDAVFAIRKKYQIKPKNPFVFRPMQPGGRVLGNIAASSQSRDYAFGQYLVTQKHLLLAGERMGFDVNDIAGSIAKAKAMRTQLKNINLANLKIGIPFPLWSEDKFHGPKHKTLNAWLPKVEHTFSNQGAMMGYHDRYLTIPQTAGSGTSDYNLSALLQGIDVYQSLPSARFFGSGRGKKYIEAQYLAVQLGAHFMRMEVLKNAPATIRNLEFVPANMKTLDRIAINPYPFFNGPWDFAAHFRDNALSTAMVVEQQPFPIDTVADFFDMTPAQKAGLTNINQLSPTQLEQLVADSDNVILPWFWMGWVLDRTLKFTNQDFPPMSAEYFAEHLWKRNQGYPIHAAFMVAKRNAEILGAPAYSLPVRNNSKQSAEMNTRVHYANKWPYIHPDGNAHPHIAAYNSAMIGKDSAAAQDRILTGAFPELTNFAENKQMEYKDYHLAGISPNKIADTQPDHLALYQRITGNMYRMFLLMMLDALNHDRPLGYPAAVHDKINKMEAFFKGAVSEPRYVGSDNEALVSLLRTQLPAEGRGGLVSVP